MTSAARSVVHFGGSIRTREEGAISDGQKIAILAPNKAGDHLSSRVD